MMLWRPRILRLAATPTFMDNPPSASSPRDLVVIEGGGGESAPEDHQPPPTLELPALLQEALKLF